MKQIQTKWTEAEFQLLRDNPRMDLDVLAEKLNRSVKSVEHARSRIGVYKNLPPWTDAEIAMVRDNPHLSLLELAKLTGRPASSCHRYRKRLEAEGATPVGTPAPLGLFHEPDAAYRNVLIRIARGLAKGDEAAAAILLTEMTHPSDDRPTVGELCGRDKP